MSSDREMAKCNVFIGTPNNHLMERTMNGMKLYELAVDMHYDGVSKAGEKVRRNSDWCRKDPNWPMEGAEFETTDGEILLLFKDEVKKKRIE